MKKINHKEVLIIEQTTGGSGRGGGGGNTGGSGRSGGTGNTGGGRGGGGGNTGGSGRSGGTGNTGGGTGNTGGGQQQQQGGGGGGVTTTPAPAPAPTQTPAPEKKQEPITKKEPDTTYCNCWTTLNFFSKKFLGNEDDKSEEFLDWVIDRTEYASYVRDITTKYDKKNCDEDECEPHQSPLVREFAKTQIPVTSFNDMRFLFNIWYNSTQKTETPTNTSTETETQTNTQTPAPTEGTPKQTKVSGGLDLTDPSVFFRETSKSRLYRLNKNNFQTSVINFKKLYDSTSLNGCKNTAKLYLELQNDSIEYSFGSPNSSTMEDYSERSKFWYGFLVILQTIKFNLKNCYSNKQLGNNKKEDSYYNRLNGISPNSYWRIQLDDWDNNGNYAKLDSKALQAANQNLVPENLSIRKKLIEYKQMKTLKESVKQKLLLKLEDKNKKIDKISENLYKIAGDFYSGDYDRFYNKYNKLVESYKNSKMYLMEDSQQSFSNALVKVFKGDEDKFIGEAIPWFINKLGLEGNVASQVESELTKKYGNESDMSSLFSDDWSDIVVTAVKDNAKSDISDPSNVMDAVEKVMMSKLDTSDFDYQLKREISKILRPAQDEKKTKIQDLANQIKKSILDQGSKA